jgi:two-component system copper resistance phosphate regulon response regulator CusR
MIRICVIEDEEKVSSFIKKGLNEHDYEVDIADNGETALEMVQANEYNLVILDVMLPDMSGIEICRQMRRHQPQLPCTDAKRIGYY